jgi:hypothetical protein
VPAHERTTNINVVISCPLHFIAISIALLVAVSVTDAAPGHTKGRPVKALTPELQTGDYVWHPEVSPAGPVVVFVSLPDQVLYVYRNGVRIGRSTASTGKHGQAGQGHANGSFHGAAEES